MPCKICKDTLLIVPCKHATGIITGEFEFEHIAINKRTWYNGHLESYIKAYKLLHDKCPCKDCLIKTMCAITDTAGALNAYKDICDKYEFIIESIKKGQW
jgi:hypothetical protein